MAPSDCEGFQQCETRAFVPLRGGSGEMGLPTSSSWGCSLPRVQGRRGWPVTGAVETCVSRPRRRASAASCGGMLEGVWVKRG